MLRYVEVRMLIFFKIRLLEVVGETWQPPFSKNENFLVTIKITPENFTV